MAAKEIRDSLVYMSRLMTKEQIIDIISKDIQRYNEAKSLDSENLKEVEQHIMFSCQLYLLHHTKGDADDVIKEMDSIKEKLNSSKPDL